RRRRPRSRQRRQGKPRSLRTRYPIRAAMMRLRLELRAPRKLRLVGPVVTLGVTDIVGSPRAVALHVPHTPHAPAAPDVASRRVVLSRGGACFLISVVGPNDDALAVEVEAAGRHERGAGTLDLSRPGVAS